MWTVEKEQTRANKTATLQAFTFNSNLSLQKKKTNRAIGISDDNLLHLLWQHIQHIHRIMKYFPFSHYADHIFPRVVLATVTGEEQKRSQKPASSSKHHSIPNRAVIAPR